VRLGQTTRLGLQNAYELADQLHAERITRSAPFYAEAHQQSIPATDRLRKLFQREPRFRQAYETGRQKANLEDLAAEMAGKPSPGLAVPELPADLATLTSLPVRALDYTKRGIDDLVNNLSAEGKATLTQQDGRAMTQLLDIFRNEVADQLPTPAYKNALSTYADYSEQLRQLKLGREGFRNRAPEEVRHHLNELTGRVARKEITPAAAEAYRIGSLQDVADIVHGSRPEGADVAQTLFGARLYGVQNRRNLDRLRALHVNPRDADEFTDFIAGEAGAARTDKRMARPGIPRRRGATEQLNPASGKVQRVAERVGITSPTSREAFAGDIADEVTLLFMKGLDDPNELVAMLRNLDALEHGARAITAQARVGAGRAVGRQKNKP